MASHVMMTWSSGMPATSRTMSGRALPVNDGAEPPVPGGQRDAVAERTAVEMQVAPGSSTRSYLNTSDTGAALKDSLSRIEESGHLGRDLASVCDGVSPNCRR
jgi:hypothetical protein